MSPRLPVQRSTARTLPAQLLAAAERAPDRPFLRFLDPATPDAPPRDVSYAAFRTLIARAAAFLLGHGLGPGRRVLILAENSPEWAALAFAAQTLRAEPAGLFASLAAGPAQEIARRVQPAVVVVSGQAQWDKLAPAAADLARSGLRAVLSLEPLSTALPAGVALARAGEALGAGAPDLSAQALAAQVAAVGGDDPYLLLFTSGTTGRQKGVRVRQRAIVQAVDCGAAAVGTTEHDLGLHLLPFGHVAGHDQLCLAVAQGHSLAMMARREDLPRALALGPTYLFSVPLVYERIRAQAQAAVEARPAPLRRLLHAALDASARVAVDGARGPGDRLLAAAARRLVGGKVRAALGGRVRALYSGGAPASVPLFRFFEGLGIPFVELYGMTETAGLVSANTLTGPRHPGCTGLPTPDHELRLAEDGELQLRGPLCFDGYLEPADDEGAFTEDGFYRTGDMARLDQDGALWITGRKKHLMVLSTGKKIAPEPVETAIAAAPPFLGAVLLGEGRPFVAAAVFVPPEELARLAAAGRNAAEALLAVVRGALDAFSEHEKPKKLVVLAGAPQDHPGLTTPTLKVKREALLALLGPQLAALYAR